MSSRTRRRYILKKRAQHRHLSKCLSRWLAHPEKGLRWKL